MEIERTTGDVDLVTKLHQVRRRVGNEVEIKVKVEPRSKICYSLAMEMQIVVRVFSYSSELVITTQTKKKKLTIYFWHDIWEIAVNSQFGVADTN